MGVAILLQNILQVKIGGKVLIQHTPLPQVRLCSSLFLSCFLLSVDSTFLSYLLTVVMGFIHSFVHPFSTLFITFNQVSICNIVYAISRSITTTIVVYPVSNDCFSCFESRSRWRRVVARISVRSARLCPALRSAPTAAKALKDDAYNLDLNYHLAPSSMGDDKGHGARRDGERLEDYYSGFCLISSSL